MKSKVKLILPHFISIVVFIFISSLYFSPAWEGETLRQDDIVKGKGSINAKKQYQKYEEKETLWNISIFSGMPEFLGANYKGASNLKKIWNIPGKMGIPTEVIFLIWYMLGFYILLLAMKVNPWLAMAGAITFGLTSYNLIIINAGHFMKVRTIALIPPVLGGVLMIFRRKYTIGLAVTALFLAMQINMGHVQMSYYFLLSLICIGIFELYFHYKQKELLTFSKTVGVLILAAFLGIAPNYAKLYSLYKYNKQTIRGKSELTIGNEGVKTKSGLDKDYINLWSSGRTESMMLFAPNVKGGASSYVKQDRDLLKEVDPQLRETIGNMNQYWGNQPGSGGPNSAGAVVVFLFVIGLFIVKGSFKKGILSSVILFILLSWGRHFAVFTDLFINYLPLYNKFRTPVSILAIGVILIIFFAFYTVSQIIKKPELLNNSSKIKVGKKNLPIYFAAGLGFIIFLLFNIAFPNLFNSYLSENEITMFDNYRAQANGSQIDAVINGLVELRIKVFRTEIFRTLLFSLAILVSIVLFKMKKIKVNTFIAIVAVLAIADVWTIGQRYVNSDDFTKKNLVEEEYVLSDIDNQIYAREIEENPGLENKIAQAYDKFEAKTDIEKEDIKNYIINKNTFYRVYNLTQSPFNENNTANAHKSIGGYHAAKLRRYQDLIEHHISKGNKQVLDMLNAKYIITKNGLQINRDVPGPAWFADSVLWANNANEEILALNKIDLKNAVINTDNRSLITNFEKAETGDKISIKEAEPDHIKYHSISSGDRLVVFSEIYYPGWTVLVDGEKADYFTVNYVLRGMIIPKGEHEIDYVFNPAYFHKANTISTIMFYLLIISVLAAFALEYLRKNRSIIKLD